MSRVLAEVRNQIKSIIKSKSGKNGIWLYLAQFFNTICPIIVIPYITRILGAEEYGVFSIALNMIGYLQVLVEYGFAMSATRKIAQNDNDEEYASRLFTLIIIARFVLLFASLLAVVVYAFFARDDQSLFKCALILCVTLVGYCLQLNWLFQGKQDMMFTAIISMFSRILSLGLTFVLVRNASDIYTYCWIYALTPFAGSLISILIAKVKYKIHFKRVNIKGVLVELKDGWLVFTTQLSSKVFSAIGLTFLGFFSTKTISGIYSAIQKIPYVITICWMPISQVLYPIMSKKYMVSFDKGLLFVKKTMLYIVTLFGLGLVLIGGFSRIIIDIAFGSEYAVYFYWLYPQLLWVFFAIVNNFLGIQTLLASGNDKQYAKCFYLAVAVNIGCNALMVYFFEGLGASIAPLLSEIVLFILLLFSVKRIKATQAKASVIES